MKVTCGTCGQVLDVADALVPRLKEVTWVEGGEFTSVEIAGWIIAWDQEAERFLTACPCQRQAIPSYRETGDVVVIPPKKGPPPDAA